MAAFQLPGGLLTAKMQSPENGPGKSASLRMAGTFVEGPSLMRTGCCPPLTASPGKRHSRLSTFALFCSSADICVKGNRERLNC